MRTLSEISVWIENLSNVKNQRDFINDSVQIALHRLYESHDWPFFMQEGALETELIESTGTIDVTNGSKTVLGTTTAFTSAMIGRKLRLEGARPYYRIAAVASTTSLTLEQNYMEADAVGQDYEIFKDEYRLAADVDKVKLMRQVTNNCIMLSISPTHFDSVRPSPSATGDPYIEVLIGTQLDTETGNISSASVKAITGSATTWLSTEGLGRLSKIRIGDNVYTVKSVNSNTSITTYEAVITVGTTTAYEITLDNLIVQVFNIPDSTQLLYYRYFRRPTPIANDSDIPDMPSDWIYLLAYGALSEVLSQKGDINNAFQVYEQKFLVGLQQMKLKIGSFSPDRIYQRKSADKVSRVPFGREEADYDRKYSL